MNYDIRYIYKITNTIVFMIVVLIYILYCRDLVFTLDLRFVEENVRKFPSPKRALRKKKSPIQPGSGFFSLSERFPGGWAK